ncbi:DUF2877 domain-containing protein [Companilactobacillus sp. HBUAS59699]|uniref:DUF2877 domain-containing protein n=1 Tax=Companilactobacillus sp. HBUAS59699 TaxID=3109358 RepID=UPI002FF3C0C8
MMKKSLLQKHKELTGERSNMLRSFVENGQSGIVDSIFRHSFNIQFKNLYFHVGNYAGGLSVLGITIESSYLNEILQNISLDDLVIYQHDILKIYASNKIFEINLSNLHEVDLTIPKVNLSIEQYKIIESSLKELKLNTKIGLEKKSLDHIESNFVSIKDLDDVDLSKLIKYMLGRGKGLTPSGDDMLVGFTSMIICSNNSMINRWMNLLSDFSQLNTTKVSTAYIRAVQYGYISKDLKELMLNMNQNKQIIIHKMQQVLQMGHTSGADTLFGVSLAINEIIGGSNNG